MFFLIFLVIRWRHKKKKMYPNQMKIKPFLFFGKQSAAQQRFTVKIKKKTNGIIHLKIKIY